MTIILFTSIILLLLSNATTLRRDKSILYSRTTSFILLYSMIILYYIINVVYLHKSISLFNGLLYCKNHILTFTMFLFILTYFILILTSFYPRKFWSERFSSFYDLIFNPTSTKNSALHQTNSNYLNKTAEPFQILEYPLIILFIIIGGIFLMSSNDLISIFLSVVVQSYGLYLLCSIYRNSEPSRYAVGIIHAKPTIILGFALELKSLKILFLQTYMFILCIWIINCYLFKGFFYFILCLTLSILIIVTFYKKNTNYHTKNPLWDIVKTFYKKKNKVELLHYCIKVYPWKILFLTSLILILFIVLYTSLMISIPYSTKTLGSLMYNYMYVAIHMYLLVKICYLLVYNKLAKYYNIKTLSFSKLFLSLSFSNFFFYLIIITIVGCVKNLLLLPFLVIFIDMLHLVTYLELQGIFYIVSLIKPLNSLPITNRVSNILCTLTRVDKPISYNNSFLARVKIVENMFYLTKKGYYLSFDLGFWKNPKMHSTNYEYLGLQTFNAVRAKNSTLKLIPFGDDKNYESLAFLFRTEKRFNLSLKPWDNKLYLENISLNSKLKSKLYLESMFKENNFPFYKYPFKHWIPVYNRFWKKDPPYHIWFKEFLTKYDNNLEFIKNDIKVLHNNFKYPYDDSTHNICIGDTCFDIPQLEISNLNKKLVIKNLKFNAGCDGLNYPKFQIIEKSNKYLFNLPEDILELEKNPMLKSILCINYFYDNHYNEPRVQNFKFFIEAGNNKYYTSDIKKKIAISNSKWLPLPNNTSEELLIKYAKSRDLYYMDDKGWKSKFSIFYSPYQVEKYNLSAYQMFYGLLCRDHAFSIEYNTLNKAKYYYENRNFQSLDISYKRAFKTWQKRQVNMSFTEGTLKNLFKHKFNSSYCFDYTDDDITYYTIGIDLYYVQLKLALSKHLLCVLETNNINAKIKQINSNAFNRMLFITSIKYVNDNIDSYQTLRDEHKNAIRNYHAPNLIWTSKLKEEFKFFFPSLKKRRGSFF
jgi:hypothetical protein